MYRQSRVHKKRNNLKYRHWVRNQYQLITTQGLNQESSGQPRTLKSPLPSIRSLDHCVFYETYCILLYIIIFSGFDSVSNYLDVQAKSNPLLPGNLTLYVGNVDLTKERHVKWHVRMTDSMEARLHNMTSLFVKLWFFTFLSCSATFNYYSIHSWVINIYWFYSIQKC